MRNGIIQQYIHELVMNPHMHACPPHASRMRFHVIEDSCFGVVHASIGNREVL